MKQSVLGVLYELFPRSESSKAISAHSRAVIRPKASPERTGLPRERWRGFRPHFQLLQANKTPPSPSVPVSVSGEPNKEASHKQTSLYIASSNIMRLIKRDNQNRIALMIAMDKTADTIPIIMQTLPQALLFLSSLANITAPTINPTNGIRKEIT